MKSDKGKMLFQTTREVIKADGVLTRMKIAHRVVPVPKRLSSECGMCIEFEVAVEQQIKDILDQQGLCPRIVYE